MAGKKVHKKRRSNGLAKRVSILEHKQKADDKNTEYKVCYFNGTSAMNDTWASIQGLAPNTQQGTGAESNMAGVGRLRIGNEINLRHWSMEAYIDLPKTTDGTPTFPLSQIPCRIILADNLTDDGLLVADDILQNPTSGPSSLVSPYKNSANASKRYRIYGDYKFTLTREKDKRIHFKMPLPKSGRVLHYQDAVSTTPSDFNMSVLFFANVAVAGTNFPNFNYTVKARFTDS